MNNAADLYGKPWCEAEFIIHAALDPNQSHRTGRNRGGHVASGITTSGLATADVPVYHDGSLPRHQNFGSPWHRTLSGMMLFRITLNFSGSCSIRF